MPETLAQRLKKPGLITAPGVFDMVSATIADRMKFDALYMTGFGVVASYLGLPDAGIATYSDMVGRVSQIAGACKTPLIADGDTGYGGLLNVQHTVLGYEAAGAQAIQLEDQEFPKKCGHTVGRRVIPMESAARKIKVAVETRSSKDFLIIARTDARTGYGLDEALRRAEHYLNAGADVLFIESPENEEEMLRICRTFDVPLIANMVEGGLTPVLSKKQLEEFGYRIGLFPVTSLLASAAALHSVYAHTAQTGSALGWSGDLYPFEDFTKLIGFEAIWEFEKRYDEREGEAVE